MGAGATESYRQWLAFMFGLKFLFLM
jgi:hypothetical protein